MVQEKTKCCYCEVMVSELIFKHQDTGNVICRPCLRSFVFLMLDTVLRASIQQSKEVIDQIANYEEGRKI
jgi:hypothetical protein